MPKRRRIRQALRYARFSCALFESCSQWVNVTGPRNLNRHGNNNRSSEKGSRS